MLTSQKNAITLPEDEKVAQISFQLISGKLIKDKDGIFLFVRLDHTSNFGTVDYEVYVKTKSGCAEKGT